MQMIKFKINLQSTPVAINPANVTHVVEKHGGTVIYFVGGGSVYVGESYLTTLTKLAGVPE